MSEQQLFTLRTDYTINYTTRKAVPIPDIIESLLSIEKMIHRTPAFLEKAYAGLSIVEVRVNVQSLQAGSLTEKFLIDYVFKGQDNYDKAKEVFDKMVQDNTAVRTIVALGIGALTTYGVMTAMSSTNTPPSTHLEAYNNTIINIGAEMKLSGAEIDLILDGIKDKKQLAQNAIGVIKPAKSDPDSTIQMSGGEELTIDKEFIRDTPDEYTPPKPEEKEEKYLQLPIQIYASDRDKTDTNWAGVIPDLVDKRIRFILGAGVNPADLHGKTRVYADVVLTSKYNKEKLRFEVKFATLSNISTTRN